MVAPIGLRAANAYVAALHRHHKPVRGCKFCVSVVGPDGDVRGVAIAGRPVARMSDDGWTLEILRVCTDGTRNACSMLYRACWRAARAIGYRLVFTYSLPDEGGASLRGAGFECKGPAGGGEWTRPSRARKPAEQPTIKIRWEARCQ